MDPLVYQDATTTPENLLASGFEVKESSLFLQGIDLMDLVKRHGTPLRAHYLPAVGSQIRRVKRWFEDSIASTGYTGEYSYAYCTKTSHFRFVIDEALKYGDHIEISSTYDVNLVKSFIASGVITKERAIICNGFKPEDYLQAIMSLIESGFDNCIPVADSIGEIEYYRNHLPASTAKPMKIGLRVACEEVPWVSTQFHMCRLGINYYQVSEVYEKLLKDDPRFEVTMLHYFGGTGMKNTPAYWRRFVRFIRKYCELRKVIPTLNTVNLGGGLQVQTSIHKSDDHFNLIYGIIRTIQWICKLEEVPEPHIVTEFGTWTAGASGFTLFSVIEKKAQDEGLPWYIVDGALITTLLDIRIRNIDYVCLALNGWDHPCQEVSLGGISCGQEDFYDAERNRGKLILPEIDAVAARGGLNGKNSLYIGFFYAGAYLENRSGAGGIQHCLLPTPKHIILNKDETGHHEEVFWERQTPEAMLRLLGYAL